MFRFTASLLVCCFVSTTVAQSNSAETADLLEPYQAKSREKWEKEIAKLEARDAEQADPDDAILFIGSSSIRRWEDIAVDMSPYRTIQRGFGGSKYSDVAVFADRLLHPHHYRALVVFVGNDVSGKPEDHSPDQVEQLVRYLIGVSRAHRPNAPVLLIEVTPTEKRFDAWPRIREVNARIREVALTTPHTYFVSTAAFYLDPEGNPRPELFVEDRLHLNADGYDLWSTLIRRRLDEVFRITDAFDAAVLQSETAEAIAVEPASN